MLANIINDRAFFRISVKVLRTESVIRTLYNLEQRKEKTTYYLTRALSKQSMLDLIMHSMEHAHGEQDDMAEVASDSFVGVFEGVCLLRYGLDVAVKRNQARGFNSLTRTQSEWLNGCTNHLARIERTSSAVS